jgi:hypothetical protein
MQQAKQILLIGRFAEADQVRSLALFVHDDVLNKWDWTLVKTKTMKWNEFQNWPSMLKVTPSIVQWGKVYHPMLHWSTRKAGKCTCERMTQSVDVEDTERACVSVFCARPLYASMDVNYMKNNAIYTLTWRTLESSCSILPTYSATVARRRAPIQPIVVAQIWEIGKWTFWYPPSLNGVDDLRMWMWCMCMCRQHNSHKCKE